MKMKIWDRFLLALYAILGILAALVVGALIYFRNQMSWNFMDYTMRLADSPLSVGILVAVALVLLVWSIRMLCLAFRHEPKVDKSSVSVQHTENGSVRISVQAMDMLVKQAIGNTEGVADIKTRIVNHEDSITVKIDMTLESDVHIPNVTMLMQRSIKNFIEEFSGIAVREVTILVGKIIEVTPQPPLQITEPKKQPEIIDQPDAIAPEPVPEQEVMPEEIEDQEPVVEYEADHQEPTESEEAEVIDEAQAEEQDEAQDEEEEHEGISEKDLW